MTYTFFGSRKCPSSAKDKLYAAIEDVIISNGANMFYIGNNGDFDALVYGVLKDIKIKYPHIIFYVVLAYIPKGKDSYSYFDPLDTIVPDGIENVPRRFAISYRNKWMIDKADGVIGYIVNNAGCSANFYDKAKKKGKHCINLCDR